MVVPSPFTSLSVLQKKRDIHDSIIIKPIHQCLLGFFWKKTIDDPLSAVFEIKPTSPLVSLAMPGIRQEFDPHQVTGAF